MTQAEANGCEVTNPMWAHEELQGSDFLMVRACGQCLWDELKAERASTEALQADLAEALGALRECNRAIGDWSRPTSANGMTSLSASHPLNVAADKAWTILDKHEHKEASE